MDVDFNVVSTVGDAVLKAYQTNQMVRQKCGPRGQQWDELDAKLLPKVKETIKELLGDGIERPRKVTTYAIRRKLNLPDKQLEKLPLCKAEILKYGESQQHFWAREVVWAVNKVLEGGQSFSWKQVHNLTNMRRVNFEACLPFIYEMVGQKWQKGLNACCKLIDLFRYQKQYAAYYYIKYA